MSIYDFFEITHIMLFDIKRRHRCNLLIIVLWYNLNQDFLLIFLD